MRAIRMHSLSVGSTACSHQLVMLRVFIFRSPREEGRYEEIPMTPQRLIFGIGAIVGTYLLVFVSLMVVMSFMASGTPEIDARNASLAMMNLIAKLVLAGAMGFV